MKIEYIPQDLVLQYISVIHFITKYKYIKNKPINTTKSWEKSTNHIFDKDYRRYRIRSTYTT